jgi:hypothetical protein
MSSLDDLLYALKDSARFGDPSHAETGSAHWYAVRDLEHYVVRNQDLLITDLERALRDDD